MRGGWKLKMFIGCIIGIIMALVAMYYTHPRPYKEIVTQTAKEFNVDKHLIYAIIKVESNFNQNAISYRGAKGLMQIMDKTGKWSADILKISSYTHDQLFVPRINLRIGSWYIGRLITQYNGEIDMALAAYNAGSGNVAKWRQNQKYSTDGKKLHKIPFKETEDYVKKVNWHYKLYNILYRD